MTGQGAPAAVSVVIGAYNAEAWIRQALDSVMAQTRPALETIVVDDGSTDRTADIVRSYGSNVRYFREEHRGRPRRNRGIREARGAYIAFLDADDYWKPGKLEAQMVLIESTGVAWAICEAEWMDSATEQRVNALSKPIPEGDILEALLLENFIVASAPVIATRIFGEVGYFDETPYLSAVEDWDFWLRIAAKFPVGAVHERLATVRMHSGSFLSATPLAQRVRSMEGIVDRAVKREPSRLSRLRKRSLSNMYYAAGVGLFRQGHFSEARGYFMRVTARQPWRAAPLGYILLTLLGRASTPIVRLKRRLGGPR